MYFDVTTSKVGVRNTKFIRSKHDDESEAVDVRRTGSHKEGPVRLAAKGACENGSSINKRNHRISHPRRSFSPPSRSNRGWKNLMTEDIDKYKETISEQQTERQ